VTGSALERRRRVSLDSVIAAMRQTGADMQSKYKETSLWGWRSILSSAEGAGMK
jgi:Serine dehydratase alpha chain